MPEIDSRISPLNEAAFFSCPRSDGYEPGVVFAERAFWGHFNVRLDPEDDAVRGAVESVLSVPLPRVPNTVSSGRNATCLWLGPDEWLVICERIQAPVLGADLQAALDPMLSSVNDLSGGQTIISLSGNRALDTMAKGCSLDLHPRVFSPGLCAQTQIAKTAALIRPLPSNVPRYDIIVRRSLADYLWRWLRNAAAEYGVGVDQPSSS
jgi:sarcosine oxidase subunit gamma